MQTDVYVALSGLLTLEDRMKTISNNVSNFKTTGFLREEVKFAELATQTGDKITSFVEGGGTYLSREPGEFIQTGNPLDVAVKGGAWLSIASPGGAVSYTRDGRMQITVEGALVNMQGDAILDAGGAPLLVDPGGGAVTIGRDGVLFQNNEPIGALGLFTLPDNARLTRAPHGSVVSDLPAEPVETFTTQGVVQGFVEASNVKPVLEITRLIEVQRAFEATYNALKQADTRQSQAIQELGKTV